MAVTDNIVGRALGLRRPLRPPKAVRGCPTCIVLLAGTIGPLFGAAAPFSIIRPAISDREGGAQFPPDAVHQPGETMFFSFQVDGFTPSSADRIHLSYKLDAYDPEGVRIMAPVSAEIEESLAPEDKNWKPVVRQEIVVPPLAGSGTYKISI